MPDSGKPKDAVHIVVHNGVITFVGANCTTAFDRPPDYFHGRHLSELVHPDDLVRLRDIFLLGGTGRFSEQFRIRDATGEWTWRRGEGVRTVDAAGDPHTVMALRDA